MFFWEGLLFNKFISFLSHFFCQIAKEGKLSEEIIFLKIRQIPLERTRILSVGNRFRHCLAYRDQMNVLKSYAVRMFLLRA